MGSDTTAEDVEMVKMGSDTTAEDVVEMVSDPNGGV